MTNDLPEKVDSDIFLFADDTKILRQVSSTDDAITLQYDLDSLERWSNDWLLKFNADKYHVLTLGKFENITYTHRYQYVEMNLIIFLKRRTIDFKLKFEQHITQNINKANTILGIIRRSFSFLDSKLFKKLYTPYLFAHTLNTPRLYGHRILPIW